MSNSEWSDGAPTGLKQRSKDLASKASQIISKTDSDQKEKGICLSIESEQSIKRVCTDSDDDDEERNQMLSAFALDLQLLSRDPNPPKETLFSVLDVLQVLLFVFEGINEAKAQVVDHHQLSPIMSFC